MTVIGLPKVLENSLNDLLKSCKLTSWNIHGGIETVQLSIRFAILDIENSTYMDTSNVTYRKMPPCQTKRNRERAMIRGNEISTDKNVDNLETIPQSRYHISNTDQDTDDILNSYTITTAAPCTGRQSSRPTLHT